MVYLVILLPSSALSLFINRETFHMEAGKLIKTCWLTQGSNVLITLRVSVITHI